MLKTIIILIAIIFLPVIASSQAPDTLWTKFYFDSLITYEPWQVIETSDSGLAVVGTRKIEAENQWDVLLIKTNTDGDTLWVKYYDYGNIDEGRSIKETPDHGFIIAGNRGQSFGNDKIFFLLKTDSLGSLSWYLPFEHAAREVRSLDLTFDGGFIVCGWAGSWIIPGHSFILKTDSLGNEEWYRESDDNGFGQRAWSVCATSDGNYILGGWSNLSSGLSQMLVEKLNSYGDTIWTRTFGDPSVDEEARSVVETDDGYIVAGDSAGAVVLKISLDGERLWTRTIPEGDMANSVFVTNSGFILAAGYGFLAGPYHYKAFIAKINARGNRQWLRIYEDSYYFNTRYGRSIIETSDHGAVYAGYSGNEEFHHIMLVKFAPNGNTSAGENTEPAPTRYLLNQNYPNPFNGKCLIEYILPQPSVVQLDIYDILGQKVATLENGYRLAGVHQVTWESGALPSGLYFYRLSSDEFSETRKMLLLK
jgi:hypothetical protein